MVSDAIIILTSGLSAFFDLRIRKIPNWLILAGLLAGLTLNAVQGPANLVQSGLGFVVGITVLVIPFALGWIGAGDVKFFGVIGALLGLPWLPRVFFYSALVAGVIAVGHVTADLFSFARLRSLWLDVKTTVVSMGTVLPSPVYARNDSRGSVPWGVAFAAGMIIAYYFDPKGTWSGF